MNLGRLRAVRQRPCKKKQQYSSIATHILCAKMSRLSHWKPTTRIVFIIILTAETIALSFHLSATGKKDQHYQQAAESAVTSKPTIATSPATPEAVRSRTVAFNPAIDKQTLSQMSAARLLVKVNSSVDPSDGRKRTSCQLLGYSYFNSLFGCYTTIDILKIFQVFCRKILFQLHVFIWIAVVLAVGFSMSRHQVNEADEKSSTLTTLIDVKVSTDLVESVELVQFGNAIVQTNPTRNLIGHNENEESCHETESEYIARIQSLQQHYLQRNSGQAFHFTRWIPTSDSSSMAACFQMARIQRAKNRLPSSSNLESPLDHKNNGPDEPFSRDSDSAAGATAPDDPLRGRQAPRAAAEGVQLSRGARLDAQRWSRSHSRKRTSAPMGFSRRQPSPAPTGGARWRLPTLEPGPLPARVLGGALRRGPAAAFSSRAVFDARPLRALFARDPGAQADSEAQPRAYQGIEGNPDSDDKGCARQDNPDEEDRARQHNPGEPRGERQGNPGEPLRAFQSGRDDSEQGGRALEHNPEPRAGARQNNPGGPGQPRRRAGEGRVSQRPSLPRRSPARAVTRGTCLTETRFAAATAAALSPGPGPARLHGPWSLR